MKGEALARHLIGEHLQCLLDRLDRVRSLLRILSEEALLGPRPNNPTVGGTRDGHLDRISAHSLGSDIGVGKDLFDGSHGGVSLLAAAVSVEAVRHVEGPVLVRLRLRAATTHVVVPVHESQV